MTRAEAKAEMVKKATVINLLFELFFNFVNYYTVVRKRKFTLLK